MLYGEKKVILANFNLTFGEMCAPMLEYFENIVFEAFKDDGKYRNFRFHDVEIRESKDFGLYIYGKIIRMSELEIDSIFDEKTKTIKDTNEKFKSSPYSHFILLLKNHTLLMIGSSKGRPTVKNFESLIKYKIKKQIKKYENNEKKELIFNLNVFEIPKASDVEKIIETFDSISNVKLKFFDLNNDTIDDTIFDGILGINKNTGAKETDVTLTSPTNIKKIAELIKKSKKFCKFTIKAKKKDEVESHTYENDRFMQPIYLTIPDYIKSELSLPNEVKSETEEKRLQIQNENFIISSAIEDERVSPVSKENNTVYNRFYEVIKKKIKW